MPLCDVFEEYAYTKVEVKLVNEPKKILSDDSIKITATAVRIPVIRGHSESLNIEFKDDFELGDIRKIFHETEGVTLLDNTDTNTYPMPIHGHGKDDIFIERIRKDESQPNIKFMDCS